MTLHSIEQKIIQFLESSDDININHLGGVSYLYKNVNAICRSKFAPEILKLLADEFHSLNKKEQKQGVSIFITTLEFCNDEFLIQEILNIAFNTNNIIRNSSLKVCLDQSANIEKNSLVRAWLLEAAFRFVLIDKSKRFRLLSNLIEISVDDCPLYLRHASKILGLAYSNWQEPDLIGKLIELKDADLGDDEVWFELGMSYLLNALNSQEHDQALSYFLLAKDHFLKSIEFSGVRPDAEAYYTALLVLTSLTDSKNTLQYEGLIDQMIKSVTIYNAWHISQENSEWVNARNTEMSNWYLLISKLEHLLIHLNEPSWFEPKVVIETYLLNIYTSSRAILKRNKDGGLEKLIQPKIEGSLINEANKIYVLDKWLETQHGSEIEEVGRELKANLLKMKNWHQSETISHSEILEKSKSQLPVDSKTSLDQFIKNCTSASVIEINPVTEQILIKVLKGVESNSSYKVDKVKRGFDILLNQSITFLESRMNGTRKDFERLSYLFENKSLPLEVALQDDLYNYLKGNLINAEITVEKSNVSSGRVDINVSFGTFNFSIEIKRDWKDCSFEAIRSNYLGQGAEYLNTDVKLGFLMVLDLTKKPHGMRSFESNIEVEIIKKDNDPIERAIVVIVVPGNRKKPSEIKIKN